MWDDSVSFRIKGFLVPSHHNAFLCKSERQNNKKDGLSSILTSDIFIYVENGWISLN